MRALLVLLWLATVLQCTPAAEETSVRRVAKNAGNAEASARRLRENISSNSSSNMSAYEMVGISYSYDKLDAVYGDASYSYDKLDAVWSYGDASYSYDKLDAVWSYGDDADETFTVSLSMTVSSLECRRESCTAPVQWVGAVRSVGILRKQMCVPAAATSTRAPRARSSRASRRRWGTTRRSLATPRAPTRRGARCTRSEESACSATTSSGSSRARRRRSRSC